MAMNNRQKNWFMHRIRQAIVSDSGCHIWQRGKTKAGYGLFEYTDDETGKRICLPAHRALYMLHHNVELGRLDFVCHSCDNPSCVNIAHLWLGTPKDNSDDKISKGRGRKGFKIPYHHRSKKYTEEHINAVKASLESGLSIKDTAAKHGMKYGYVRDISAGVVKRDAWRDYPISQRSHRTWQWKR